MKMDVFDGAIERTILYGMATDDAVLARVTAFYSNGAFGSQPVDTAARLMMSYGQRHGRAPGKDLTDLFVQWAAGRDEATVRAVELLLQSLDGRGEEALDNPDHVVQLARDHFESVRLARVRDELGVALEKRDVPAARQVLAKYAPLDAQDVPCIDLFHDVVAVRAALEYRHQPPLYEYGGGLGDFFGDALRKGEFLAITAPDKSGKCVAGDTEVLLADGQVKTIAELVKLKAETQVVCLNELTGKLEPTWVGQFWDNGEKVCWEVETKSGRRLVTTPNHQYLTPEGWKSLQSVGVGDFIAVPRQQEYFGSSAKPEAEVKFLAYMLADGCCVWTYGKDRHGNRKRTGCAAIFTKGNADLRGDFESCCDALGVTYRQRGIADYLIGPNVKPLLRRLGLEGHSSKSKTVPPGLFRCPREQVALFLRVFFSCDGCINREGTKIELALANERMTRQMSHLLNRFGIVHKFRSRMTTFEGRPYPVWGIYITCRYYTNKFLREIGLMSYKSRVPVDTDDYGSFLDRIPWQVAKQMLVELSEELACVTASDAAAVFGSRKRDNIISQITRRKCVVRQSFCNVTETKTYKKYVESDVLWDEVVSVRSVGKRPTYDLGVAKYHNFVAGDCIVHNSYLLQDFAWRLATARKRVLYFEAGDLMQSQLIIRFLVRASRIPDRPGTVMIPTGMEGSGEELRVVLEEHEFETALDFETARDALQRVLDIKIKSADPFLQISCHPNSTLKVADIRAVVEQQIRQGWHPDAIIVDYADILAPPPGFEGRDQIDATWRELAALRQRYDCFVATATQCDTDGYSRTTLSRGNFSNDKRKNAHVSSMLGINQTSGEKEQGLYRLNWILRRDRPFNERRVCYVAACLGLANPTVLSQH